MCPPSPVGGNTAGVELLHEHRDPFGLVALTDGRCHLLQAAQAAQEPAIGLVGPTDVAGAPPAIGSEGIEPAVVTDTKRGVPLDLVATEAAERGPGVQRSRVGNDDLGDERATIIERRARALVEARR